MVLGEGSSVREIGSTSGGMRVLKQLSPVKQRGKERKRNRVERKERRPITFPAISIEFNFRENRI